ncbi:MAG: replicative DNA helicase [Acidobacteria bacterium]|nr:replicative DNA helicase [Acidobacteriota bacterium]MBI3663090.1 replicative DNA helicase [Acidobacteriota bacterium]
MATQAVLERPLPHNLDAERSILGAVLLDNHALDLASEKLRPDEFFLDQHRRIYERMVELREVQQAIDLVTLADELARHGELEAAGGPAYLAQLVDGVPRVSNVEHYARIVREKALLRNLVHTAHSIQQKALEAEEGADDILDSAESLIFQLAEERIRVGFVGVKDVVKESFERLHRILTEGRKITGLSTGYNQLDTLTSGLQDSELIILAARPSLGKTALALNIAENVAVRAEEPRTVAIFSLEMSKESLLLRMLSSQAQIDAHKFRTGRLGHADWNKMTTALGQLGEAPLWLDDSGSSTVVEIGAKSRRLKRDKGLSLIIVDYLQLISGRGRFTNRVEEVSSISRGLKALAKELKVPVLVLSQLTRAPEREERKPQLADLRESGAIEQDADVVMFIHRPNFYNKDVPEEERRQAELIVAKQRNGPTDRINFVFFEKHTRFEEAAPDAWGTPS